MTKLYNLVDARLDHRCHLSLNKILERPDSPLPHIFPEYADLEGFYRLIKNPRLSKNDFMNNIAQSTVDRISETEVAVIHDTSFFNPKLNLKNKKLGSKGLMGHLSLAASTGEHPQVYGALNLEVLKRDGSKKSDKESARWMKGVEASEGLKGASLKMIHIMDREGDIYQHLLMWQERRFSYVIRACKNRKTSEYEGIFDVVEKEPSRVELTCRLSKREEHFSTKHKKIHPKREAREAKLHASAKRLEIKKPSYLGEISRSVEVNVVRVWEEGGPEESQVEWFLLTSENIDSAEDIKKVIHLYRRRWLIEEFFKGLKTGCKIEEKQFEGQQSWEKLLAFYMPVTAKIMNLRLIDKVSLSSLKLSLSETQIEILEAYKKLKIKDSKDLILALASLGGHIKYNGPPGWQVLHRAYKELQLLEMGWRLKM